MEKIRTFIAVELPAAVREYLGSVTAELAAHTKSGLVRWVRPERMHLTLCFLGETAVSQVPAVAAALDRVAVQQRPFQLQLTELGAFPNQKRPRVVWVGLGGEMALLAALKQQVDEALLPLGWPPEKRPFNPHLTLGRVKDSGVGQQIRWQTGVEQLVIPVTAVHLIESQLRPDGPRYTIRHSSRWGE
ncbi:MAG: RNA 2',3'-cyclic phosphodiesterase [Chloroflexota bacterium]